MGVKIHKRGGKWYVFVNYHGRRKSKCVGSREAAEQVRRALEAKLALGDLTVLDLDAGKIPPSMRMRIVGLRTTLALSARLRQRTAMRVF